MVRFFILVLILSSLNLFSQAIVVSTNTETYNYNLSTVQSLYFEMDNLYIQTDTVLDDFPLADIQSISFGDGTSAPESVIPLPFILSQNHPNPFNPDTTISFALQSTGNVVLEIYNLKGQKVKTLVNGTLASGDHKYEWNGSDEKGDRVSSGIYLYRLNVQDRTESKKMMLLK